MSLRQRLRATLALQPASEKREKALVEELEKAKREMDELNEKIMATENEKVWVKLNQIYIYFTLNRLSKNFP